MVRHFAFNMKRDLSERLIYGHEFDYVSVFFTDRTLNHGALPIEEVCSRRCSTREHPRAWALEWYRAFRTRTISAR